MCSRGKFLVSLCRRNEEEHESSANVADQGSKQEANNLNLNSRETRTFATNSKKNEDNHKDKHVTAENSDLDFQQLEAEDQVDSEEEYIPQHEESGTESDESDEPLAKKSTLEKINARNMEKKYCKEKSKKEHRRDICLSYWKLDYCRQKDFILVNVSNCTPKVHRVRNGAGARKESSRKYNFKKGIETVQVCKNFFLKTLCISHGPVDHALRGVNETGVFGLSDKRGKRIPKNKTPDDLIKKVKAHIESFPTMESHYCRKSSSRLYLDSNLSISKMYDLYLDWCRENKEESFVSEITYRRTFCNDYNMAFFSPKKDQCEICAQYKNKTITEEDYNEHLRRRDEATTAKNVDKIRANENNTFLCATFDLQSILQIPASGVSQMYYSLKLCAYNLTIYEAASPNNAFCFAWTEINGQRGSSEIGTALLKWINKIPDGIKEISLYSDTCSRRNRNQFIAALFLYVVQYTNLEVVQHNFLEKGHSYMEVDSMHSAIEKAKKHCEIYTMNELLNVFKLARSKRLRNKTSAPYNVEELRYCDFLDLKSLASAFLKNRSEDESGHKVSCLKIKVMRYEKHRPGCILFKYNYSDAEFRVLRVFGRGKPAEIPEVILPLYKSILPIPEKKKKSLLKLCLNNIIPPEYHAWYKSIPVDKKRTVTIPEPVSSDSYSEEDSE